MSSMREITSLIVSHFFFFIWFLREQLVCFVWNDNLFLKNHFGERKFTSVKSNMIAKCMVRFLRFIFLSDTRFQFENILLKLVV